MAQSKTIQYAHWLFGIVVLGAVVVAANHFGEAGELLELFRKARPEWLFAALLFQVGTYLWARSGIGILTDIEFEKQNRQAGSLYHALSK